MAEQPQRSQTRPALRALVTGASGAIGGAIAAELARGGVHVIATARERARAEAAVGRLRAAGGSAEALVLDVADEGSLTAAAAALEKSGGVDWLVNNAGIAESAPWLEHRDAAGRDLYQRHMEVDFHGPRRLAQRLVPGMLARGRGRVLNVASSAGLMGYSHVAGYVAAKHALVGWTRAVAEELGRRSGEPGTTGTPVAPVAIGALCPHYVDTPMLDAGVSAMSARTGKDAAAARAAFARKNPGGRLVTVEEVAVAAADWLRSGKNGAVIELDGSSPREVVAATRKESAMELRSIEPPGWKPPAGYANGIVASAPGRILFVAGQIAWDAEQRIVGGGDLALQFRQALANVAEVVRVAGGEPRHVARMTVYVLDKASYLAQRKPIGAAWREFFGRHYPAMALVQVAALLEPGALVEIEATAVLP